MSSASYLAVVPLAVAAVVYSVVAFTRKAKRS